jgi:hypothetical protein
MQVVSFLKMLHLQAGYPPTHLDTPPACCVVQESTASVSDVAAWILWVKGLLKDLHADKGINKACSPDDAT